MLYSSHCCFCFLLFLLLIFFLFFFFFFNDTATTEIYTLSLHDALPIYLHMHSTVSDGWRDPDEVAHLAADHGVRVMALTEDRKSTRLNSSHVKISYAVFCLKKKKKKKKQPYPK